MEILQHQGKEFIEAEPGEVLDFLRSRSIWKLHIPPEDLHVVNDGSRLYLHCSYGGLREYPIRKAFLLKLLRWFNFPNRLLNRLDIDTVTMVLNDFLLNISSGDVTVTLEDGDALTVTSVAYSEVTDLDVLNCCAELGVQKISRNDYFMRIYSEARCEVEPEPGDICSFAYNVVNSETGFRALSLSHYILRYICSNGAAVPVKGMQRRSHYGYAQGELFGLLRKHLAGGEALRSKIVEALKSSIGTRLNGERDKIVRSVDVLLGNGSGSMVFRRLPADATQYDLFNELTSMAKQYPIGIRLQLEMIAGGLLI